MSSKTNPVWDDSLVQALKDSQEYAKIENGKLTNKKLALTGAKLRWKTAPNDIYMFEYRIVGSPEDLKTFLKSIGKSEDLSKGYTPKTVLEEFKEQYEDEIKKLEDLKIEYEDILADNEKIKEIYRKELLELKKKYLV